MRIEKTIQINRKYELNISLSNINPLFDLWMQKDKFLLDENGKLSFYEFRFSFLKISINIYGDIFYS